MRRAGCCGRLGRPRDWTAALLVALAAGCGTTRVSDTPRTATEQLLISHSIDETVSNLDFRMLADKRVYLDAQYLDGVTDKGYLVSSLRQHLLACGCLLQEERKSATYVVEARSGGIGTDRNDLLLFGVPQMNILSVSPGVPAGMVPEVPLAKKTNRRGVAKIAVFAFNRVSGQPVWQSGALQASSDTKVSWVFGAGPFQRGSLNRDTESDGQTVAVPVLDGKTRERGPSYSVVSVTQAAFWQRGPLPDDPPPSKAKLPGEPGSPAHDDKVIQASDSPPRSESPAEKPE